MARHEQYRLHAYVCGNACLQHATEEGTVTFWQVFMRRPGNCRYAVVTHYDVASHADVVLVWDLYETQETLKSGQLQPPEPLYRGDCIDAAIMQTFMTYQDS